MPEYWIRRKWCYFSPSRQQVFTTYEKVALIGYKGNLWYMSPYGEKRNMVQLCTECAKACRILEVEETERACRFEKPYPSTFFAFCWHVQFSLLQFASWTCIKQWNEFHCLKLCMEAGAGGVGSLARLLIQDHSNSSLLQKSMWPTKKQWRPKFTAL